jgi:hypothetical protein
MDYRDLYSEYMKKTGTAAPTDPMLENMPSTGRFDFSSQVQTTPTTMSPQQAMPPMTPADLNQEVIGTGQNFRELGIKAEREELSRFANLRELQRQSVARQGSTMYEQAQMAMSQRQLMSDARGLSGGAQEFAQRGLGAQEQMVLAQIKNSTIDQLMQVDAASVQDPRVALEYGNRVMELAKQTDPGLITAEGILQQAQMARDEGNLTQANQLMTQYFEQINQLYGSSIPTGPGVPPEAINQALIKKVSDLSMERTPFEEVVGWAGALLLPAGGSIAGAGLAGGLGKGLGAAATGLAAKGAVGKAASVILGGAAAVLGGKVLIGLAIAGAVIWAGSELMKQYDRSQTGDAAIASITRELQNERTRLSGLGYTPEQVNAIIDAIKEQAQLPPKYNNIG